MEPALGRSQLEAEVEARLLAVARAFVGGVSGLAAAYDFFPSYFGGVFPALGVSVVRTEGISRFANRPARPGILAVEARIYQPCLPILGAQSPQQDRIGEARRLTRVIRGAFLEAVMAETVMGPYVEVLRSEGRSHDAAGNAVTDERGQSILWVDTSEMRISA